MTDDEYIEIDECAASIRALARRKATPQDVADELEEMADRVIELLGDSGIHEDA